MKKLNKIENYIFTFKGKKKNSLKSYYIHLSATLTMNMYMQGFLLEYTEMFPLIVIVM